MLKLSEFQQLESLSIDELFAIKGGCGETGPVCKTNACDTCACDSAACDSNVCESYACDSSACGSSACDVKTVSNTGGAS
jgi:hypothetical protein